MARKRHSELAAGLFVIAALAAGIAVLLWLGMADVFGPRGDMVVFTASQEAGNLGLEIGSTVKVNDNPIGKIEAMRLDLPSKRTLYIVRLTRRDVKVHMDARATAVAEFIGGASIVLNSFGTDDAPLADEKNPANLIAANTMLLRIQEALGYGDDQRGQFQLALKKIMETTVQMERIASTLGLEISTDDPNVLLAHIKDTVANLRTSSVDLTHMTKSLKAQLDKKDPESLLAKVCASADNVKLATGEAAGMMKTIRPDVEKTAARVRQYTEKDLADILTNFRKANTNLINIAADLQAVSATAKDIVVLNRHNIDDTLVNLKSMSMNLNAAAKEIRRNPWRLLARPGEEQTHSENIYDAARAFSEGASQLDDALTRLAALRDARPKGVRTDDPELIRIRKNLLATFERFRKVEDGLWDALKQKK